MVGGRKRSAAPSAPVASNSAKRQRPQIQGPQDQSQLKEIHFKSELEGSLAGSEKLVRGRPTTSTGSFIRPGGDVPNAGYPPVSTSETTFQREDRMGTTREAVPVGKNEAVDKITRLHDLAAEQLLDDLRKDADADRTNPGVTATSPTHCGFGEGAFDLLLPDVNSLFDSEQIDLVVCEKMHHIRALVEKFANELPAADLDVGENMLSHILIDDNAELVSYINRLAAGGPHGQRGWETLLRDTPSRQTLVAGIIGRALQEHVFGELWFGANKEQKEMLKKLERDQANHDGFSRTQERARAIARFNKDTWSLNEAKTTVSLQLHRLLTPLWNCGSTAKAFEQGPLHILTKIVSQAADLSRWIRQLEDVVYHWPATFKDEEFDPSRMECRNLERMLRESPYRKEGEGQSVRCVLQDGHGHRSEAIVRIVGLPGLVAYRPGGGAVAGEELKLERGRPVIAPPDVQAQAQREADHCDNLTGHEGIRTRLICKSVVHLMWSKQRLLTKEAGTLAHRTAMEAGGVRYFRDIRGFEGLSELFKSRRTVEPGSAEGLVSPPPKAR